MQFTKAVKQLSTVRMANDFAQFAALSPQKGVGLLDSLPSRAHHLLWYTLTQFDAREEKVPSVVLSVEAIRKFIEDMAAGNNRKSMGKWNSYKEDIQKLSVYMKSLTALIEFDMKIHKDAPNRKYAPWKKPVNLFKVYEPRINAQGKPEYYVEIDDEMQNYLYNISTKYTSFQPRKHARLKNKHALRFYPALKSRVASTQKHKIENRYEATIPELRRLLAIPDGAYPKDSKFYTHVIDKAVNDINENSDIWVDVQKNKSGRHLASLTFYIQLSRASKDQLALSFHEKVGAKYKMLKEQSQRKAHEIDVGQFRAFYSTEYRIIRAETIAEYKKLQENAKRRGEEMTDATVEYYTEARIDGRVRAFIFEELATYGDNGTTTSEKLRSVPALQTVDPR